MDMDSDNDGLTDTQELEGWTVVITYEATREVKERREIVSNPRDVDSDNDGMTDYEEFTNNTDPNESDSDGDGKTDLDEISGDYNSSATGIDGTPPEIWHFKCDYEQDYADFFFIKLPSGGLKVFVEVGVRDIFGIDYVNVDIRGLEDILLHCGGNQNVSYRFEWSIDSPGEYERVLFKGFQINVSAKDINGNLGFKESELPSVKDRIVELLGPLIAFAKYLIELASSIFSWIFNLIEKMVMNIVKNVENIMNGIVQRTMNFLEPLVNFIRNDSHNITLLREGISEIVDIIFNPIPYLLGISLMVILAVIHCIVTGVSFGAADVIMIVADFGLILLLTLMDGQGEGDEDGEGTFNPIGIFMNEIEGNDDESSKSEDQGFSMLIGLLIVFEEIILGVLGYIIGVEKMGDAFLAGKKGEDFVIAIAKFKKAKFYYQMSIIFGVTSSIFSTLASLVFGNIIHKYVTDNDFSQVEKDSATNYAITGGILSFIAALALFGAVRCMKESAVEKFQPKIPKFISLGITIFGICSWVVSLLLGMGSLYIILT